MQCAQALYDATYDTTIVSTFKTSFDKVNRIPVHRYCGVDMDKDIRVFEYIKQECSLSITTDIHELGQVKSLCR